MKEGNKSRSGDNLSVDTQYRQHRNTTRIVWLPDVKLTVMNNWWKKFEPGQHNLGTDERSDVWPYGSVSVIGFLSGSEMVISNDAIHDVVAIWLVSLLMERTAATALTSRLTFKPKSSKIESKERVSMTYSQMVSHLLEAWKRTWQAMLLLSVTNTYFSSLILKTWSLYSSSAHFARRIYRYYTFTMDISWKGCSLMDYQHRSDKACLRLEYP